MKKNKNDNPTKENENIRTAEKIRDSEKNDGELTFRKVLYGYDPDEVTAFISELRETHENTARIHESKLSSLKEELILSNRERDYNGRELKKLRSKLGTPEETPTDDGKIAEYEAIIAKLKEELEQAKEENYRISEEIGNDALISNEKFAALEAENRELAVQLEAVRRENAELVASVQRYDSLYEEYSALMSKAEKLGSELEAKINEADGLREEVLKKTEEIKTLYSENGEIAKKSAELEVRNGVLNRQVTETQELVERLRAENITQANESAEKISEIENGHAKFRVEAQKEAQLREYYVSRAELTLAELTKQIEQIRQSIGTTAEE